MLSPTVPPAFAELLRDTTARLRLRRLPAVVFSARAASPAVFGVWRPVLIMPLGLQGRGAVSVDKVDMVGEKDKMDGIDKRDNASLRHVLLHELAHIKRGDAGFNRVFQRTSRGSVRTPLTAEAAAVSGEAR